MLRFFVVAGVISLSGCLLWEHGSGGQCPVLGDDAPPQTGGADGIAQDQRNPQNLTCENFSGGGECNPDCGPCPLAGDLAPIPTWGVCGSTCEGLDEGLCSTNPSCRVVKDVRCAIDGNCLTDFLGCFPTDQQQFPGVDCTTADAQSCSESNACTAFHRNDPCGLADSNVPAQCTREFAFCMPEGASPGRCFDFVACDAVGPSCPSGSMPGIINGCFSGACIPQDLCEALPPQP